MVLRREITAKIRELLGQNPKGLSITQIVRSIEINRNTAGRYLENLMLSGQVEMRQYGMAKIYRLAQRVPLSTMLSISSELILLMDNGLRIIYANEPMYRFLGTTQTDLYGKNIEYTPFVTVFNDTFESLKKHLKTGLTGKEWKGELVLTDTGVIFSCRIAPAVFEEGQRGVSILFEDITDRKRAEEELRESEDRYRKLVEISPDAVILHRHGKILYMNPAALDLIGVSNPRKVMGKNVLDFVHPGFYEAVLENIKKDLDGDSTPPMELHMIRADGSSVTVEGRGVRTTFGGEPAVQVALRDITERKQAEEAVRESEATARALINAPTDSILLLDTTGVILDLNETAALRMGVRREDLIGVLCDSVLPRDLANQRRSIISRVLKTRELVRFEDTRDDIWFDTVAYPILGANGDVNRIAIIARDITDRKNVEKTLKESEEQYRALVERANDGICVIQDGVIRFCNQRIAEFWGGSVEEVLGSNFTDFIHPDALPGVIDLYRRRMCSEPLPSLYETKLRQKDGSIFFAEVNAGIISYGGKPGDLVIIRDINDRKKAELALRESEGKLRAMLESISDPMSMIDRDLNIIWANDTARRYFGSDIVGRKCHEAFHQRHNPCEPYPCLTLRAFDDEKMHHHKTTVIDKEGKTRHFDCTTNVALRDENGRPTAVLEISREIPELKRAEKPEKRN